MTLPASRSRRPLACLGLALLLVGCAAGPSPRLRPPPLQELHGTRWVFMDASCSDGPLALGARGFERELRLEQEAVDLLLTYDSALVAEGCSQTEVVRARAGEAGSWTLQGEAVVTLPRDSRCAAPLRQPLRAELQVSGPVLEVLEYGSPWCKGFDAHFTYHRVEPVPLSERQVVTRYAAHFNRRDARAVAGLFAQSGSLVEPFSDTGDGNYRRHEGREAIQRWYRNAFDTAPWLAMRLTSVVGRRQGRQEVSWEYMDERLEQPLSGRNLFVIAAGEIYETELQLLDAPRPRAAQSGGECDGG